MNIYRGRTHTEFYLASSLYDAVKDNDLTSVLVLLKEKHADPNLVLPCTGVSSFHLAVGCGTTDNQTDSNTDGFDMQCVTAMLLYGGANPNVCTDEGLTPLHIAAAWGLRAIVQILLQNGANPDITDNCYRTAQKYAQLYGHDDIAKSLRDYVRHLQAAILTDRLDEPSPNQQCKLTLDKIILNTGDDVAESAITRAACSATYHLDTLPTTNVPKYVATWCEAHYRAAQESDGGVGTSRDPSPPTEVQQRPGRRHADTASCKCSNESRASDIITLPDDESLNSGNSGRGRDDDTFAQFNNARIDFSQLESSIQSVSSSSPAQLIVSTPMPPPDTSSDYFTCSGTGDNAAGDNSPVTVDSAHAPKCSVGACSINDSNGDVNVSGGGVGGRKGVGVGGVSNDSGASGMSAASSAATKRSSIVSVQEVYKYTDSEHNVRLYEKRLILPKQSILDRDDARSVASHYLPGSLDYDVDTLRKELTALGFEPGPITSTTRRVYLRKLYRMHTNPPIIAEQKIKYCHELERTLRHDDWSAADLSVHMMTYRHLDEAVSNQFATADANRRWREGNSKGSFTYLLLDPRVTQNLPGRAEQMTVAQVWRTFVSGVFYVGKGKRSRPYRHLYDALRHWNTPTPSTRPPTPTTASDKLQRIVDIWHAGHGVICLHVFQNVIAVEAYCREAAMICSLGAANVTNARAGEFYGVTAAWSAAQKRQYGCYLLYRAMQIFLYEGERQLCPTDID